MAAEANGRVRLAHVENNDKGTGSRFRCRGFTAGFVPVPETPVDQDHGSPAFHYNVRPARQASVLQAISHTEPTKGASDGTLRCRVLATDRCHIGAAANGSKAISHFALNHLGLLVLSAGRSYYVKDNEDRGAGQFGPKISACLICTVLSFPLMSRLTKKLGRQRLPNWATASCPIERRPNPTQAP